MKELSVCYRNSQHFYNSSHKSTPTWYQTKTQSIWPIKIHEISSFFLLFQILILLGEEPSFLLCTKEFIHQYNHPNYPCKLRQNYLWYTLRGNQSLNLGKLSLLKQNLGSSMSKIQKCITEIPFALVYWPVRILHRCFDSDAIMILLMQLVCR